MNMKYYEMHKSERQGSQGLMANDTNEEYIPLISGNPLDKNIKQPIKYILEKAGSSKTFQPEIQEFLNTGGGGILIHNRVKKVFQSLCKHHTLYKSEVEYLGEKLNGLFYTMNLEILYPAMNLDKSEYGFYASEKNRISYVRKLILSRKKLKKIPKDEHLFRLKEFRAVTIIDEYGKNLIEEAKVIGVEFVELEIAD